MWYRWQMAVIKKRVILTRTAELKAYTTGRPAIEEGTDGEGIRIHAGMCGGGSRSARGH